MSGAKVRLNPATGQYEAICREPTCFVGDPEDRKPWMEVRDRKADADYAAREHNVRWH